MTPMLTDADYAAIVKRYEDAGDVQNADIIRRQWEVARGSGDAHHKTAETRMDAVSHGGAGPVDAHLAKPSDDGGQWIVLGGQRIGKQHLLDLQRDAARYRWLRDKADSMACTSAPMVANLDAAGRIVGLIDGEELDAAVDMAAARRTTKAKRVGASR